MAVLDLFRLDGRTALVLGAASGIGKASAEALAALGASVICADRDKAGVEATAADLAPHVRSEAHVLDAGDGDAVNGLAEKIAADHKSLDIAVTTPAIHVRKLEPSRMASGCVHFTPGARTAWHSHALGQTLYVTEGTGLVQSRGEPVVTIRAGDIIHTPPEEWHWHGAAPDQFMTHLSITDAPAGPGFFLP